MARELRPQAPLRCGEPPLPRDPHPEGGLPLSGPDVLVTRSCQDRGGIGVTLNVIHQVLAKSKDR